MIQIDVVGLISIFVECLLYGISLVLYTVAACMLFRRRSITGLNRPMLCTIAVMLTLGTIHVGADLRRVMIAFLYSSAGPKEYLAEVNTNLYVIRSTAYFMQTLLGDGVVLWRLYVIWNGDKRVCIPFLISFLSNVALGIGVLRSLAVSSPNSPIFDVKTLIASFYSVTLATNLVGSTLLAWRILWISRQMETSRVLLFTTKDRRVTSAAVIVVESGVIHSIVIGAQLALYVCVHAACQLTGIVFSLIIIRVSELYSRRRELQCPQPVVAVVTGVGLSLTSDAAKTTQISDGSSTFHSISARASRRHPDEAYAMDPVQVHITTVTHDEDGVTLNQATFSTAAKRDEKQSVRSRSPTPDGMGA